MTQPTHEYNYGAIIARLSDQSNYQVAKWLLNRIPASDGGTAAIAAAILALADEVERLKKELHLEP